MQGHVPNATTEGENEKKKKIDIKKKLK